MRVLAYCLMPNHWHLVLWPRRDGELSEYLRWVTVTHTQRWHAHYHTSGTGPLYQGRFKSFPVQSDEHLLKVCRYVERNALQRIWSGARRIGVGRVSGEDGRNKRQRGWWSGRSRGQAIG